MEISSYIENQGQETEVQVAVKAGCVALCDFWRRLEGGSGFQS